jgi:hypothetical protein
MSTDTTLETTDEALEELDKLIAEAAVLKADQEAVNELLAEKSKQISDILRSLGLQKWENEGCRVSFTNKTKIVVNDTNKIFDHIADKEEFACAAIENLELTRAFVHAMDMLGIPFESYGKKSIKRYLRIAINTIDDNEMLKKARMKYREKVLSLRRRLVPVVMDNAVLQVVDPDKNPVPKLVYSKKPGDMCVR